LNAACKTLTLSCLSWLLFIKLLCAEVLYYEGDHAVVDLRIQLLLQWCGI